MPSIICALADCIISLLCSLLHTGKLLTLLIIYQGIKSKQSDCSICDDRSLVDLYHTYMNYIIIMNLSEEGEFFYREKM